MSESKQEWQEGTYRQARERSPERDAAFQTSSGKPVEPLSTPEDIAAEECSTEPFEIFHPRRPHPDPLAIEKAVNMIRESKMPLILIGAAANRNRT